MGAVGSKSKEPKPYPFSFPQHQPSQFYPGYPSQPSWPGPWPGYDEKTMSSMYPDAYRKKKKKSQKMNPAMGMGWGQGYAPFPYPPMQGYHMPPYMPGMMPGMMPGPGMQMPVPQPAQPAQPAQNGPAPVIPTSIAPNPPVPQPVIPSMPSISQPHHQPSRPPPLFTPGDGAQLQSFPGADITSPPPPRRAQTPFHRRPSNEESEDSDPTPPPVIPPSSNPQQCWWRSESENITAVLGNHTPPSEGVFGPPGGRPRTPPRNPLPPPPKDLYETTPYKGLLNLPQTTALLTAAYGASNPGGAAPVPQPMNAAATNPPPVIPGGDDHRSQTEAKKKGRGFGLFRSLTSSGGSKGRPVGTIPSTSANATAGPSRNAHSVDFHPVFAPPRAASLDNHSVAPASHSPTTPEGGQPPASNTFTPSTTVIPPNPVPGSHIPTLDPTVPPVHFTQASPLAGFLNHSPHRVLYRNRIYPTATHLFEAMKYLDGAPGQPGRPDLAERIEKCGDVLDVYPLSAEFQSKGFVRSDWGLVYESCMDEVLCLKFRQHPNLRTDLMRTGMAPIIYDDPSDDYWGTGPSGDGANQLGISLVKVRARLRAEGYGI
ncbi:hypothetical protein ONZ45_g11977 [Pleurotus djamor]|nr:hypothetical protein ONZ45_g11977 [Pleurotus djamor]